MMFPDRAAVKVRPAKLIDAPYHHLGAKVSGRIGCSIRPDERYALLTDGEREPDVAKWSGLSDDVTIPALAECAQSGQRVSRAITYSGGCLEFRLCKRYHWAVCYKARNSGRHRISPSQGTSAPVVFERK